MLDGIYKDIKSDGVLIGDEASRDYSHRCEHWQRGRYKYAVLIKVDRCFRDQVVKILGSFSN